LKRYIKDPISKRGRVNLLDRYLKIGIKTTRDMIKFNSSNSIKEFQEIRREVDRIFKFQKENSYANFTDSIKYVSDETNRFLIYL